MLKKRLEDYFGKELGLNSSNFRYMLKQPVVYLIQSLNLIGSFSLWGAIENEKYNLPDYVKIIPATLFGVFSLFTARIENAKRLEIEASRMLFSEIKDVLDKYYVQEKFDETKSEMDLLLHQIGTGTIPLSQYEELYAQIVNSKLMDVKSLAEIPNALDVVMELSLAKEDVFNTIDSMRTHLKEMLPRSTFRYFDKNYFSQILPYKNNQNI